MQIEYKITFGPDGAITVTQRVEPGASTRVVVSDSGKTAKTGTQKNDSKAVELPDAFPGQVNKSGTRRSNDLGGEEEKPGSGGSAPPSGVAIIFGPIILAGAGLDERGGEEEGPGSGGEEEGPGSGGEGPGSKE